MGEKKEVIFSCWVFGPDKGCRGLVHIALRTLGFCLLWTETAEAYLKETDVMGYLFDIFQYFLEEEFYEWSAGYKTPWIREGMGFQIYVQVRSLHQHHSAQWYSAPRVSKMPSLANGTISLAGKWRLPNSGWYEEVRTLSQVSMQPSSVALTPGAHQSLWKINIYFFLFFSFYI